MFIDIAIVFVMISLSAQLLLMFIEHWNKNNHGGDNSYLRWWYRFRHFKIPIPDLYLSTYYAKSVKNRVESMSEYFCTLDDPVLKQIAEDFSEKFKDKGENFKAACLLAMVQQNVKYYSDLNRFEELDAWVFPIRTLEDKIGDCEDSSFLYAGLASLIGLDVVLIRTKSHMVPGVHLADKLIFDYGFTVNGKTYYPAETTSSIPILGLESDIYAVFRYAVEPVLPSEMFFRAVR